MQRLYFLFGLFELLAYRPVVAFMPTHKVHRAVSYSRVLNPKVYMTVVRMSLQRRDLFTIWKC